MICVLNNSELIKVECIQNCVALVIIFVMHHSRNLEQR
jgi:hypothetical protein